MGNAIVVYVRRERGCSIQRLKLVVLAVNGFLTPNEDGEWRGKNSFKLKLQTIFESNDLLFQLEDIQDIIDEIPKPQFSDVKRCLFNPHIKSNIIIGNH